MGVASLGYVIAQTRDLSAWRLFGSHVLGMMEAKAPDGSVAFRIDDRPFRVMVQQGEADGVVAAGLEFATEDAFAQAVDA